MLSLKLRIGEVVRQRGMTARELAEQSGIAVATARALVLGENERIDIPVIARVAAALKVRPLELFEEIEIQTASEENPSDIIEDIEPLALVAA